MLKTLWRCLALGFGLAVLAACAPGQADLPTLAPTFTAAAPATTAPPAAPSETPAPFCTPPPCAADETYACGAANGCVGGCGTICVTKTPDPAQPSATPSVVIPTVAVATVSPSGDPLADLPAGTALTMAALKMLDAQTGWAVAEAADGSDDRILRTFDGGATWREVTPPQPVDATAEIGQGATLTALNGNQAWVTYYNRIGGPLANPVFVWRTADGGATWQASLPLDASDVEMYLPSDLVFVDSANGWLLAHVGAGMSHDYVVVFHTTDGGLSWVRQVDPYNEALPQSCSKTGLAFADAQTGWITGDCFGVQPGAPYLQRTTDGGATWQAVELPAPDSAPALYQTDTIACGVQAPAYAASQAVVLPVECRDLNSSQVSTYLYRTQDAGAQWDSRAIPGDFQSALFLDAATGWVLMAPNGEGDTPRDLLVTTDSAASLTKAKTVTWTGRFVFVSPEVGWAVAESAEGKALVKTTDGGRTWAVLTPVIAAP